MISDVRLDRKGIREVLLTGFVDEINELAEDIAANVRLAHDVDVEVDAYTTDRGAAAVTIADARGMFLQASDGALTRAAAAAGLEVTSR